MTVMWRAQAGPAQQTWSPSPWGADESGAVHFLPTGKNQHASIYFTGWSSIPESAKLFLTTRGNVNNFRILRHCFASSLGQLSDTPARQPEDTWGLFYTEPRLPVINIPAWWPVFVQRGISHPVRGIDEIDPIVGAGAGMALARELMGPNTTDEEELRRPIMNGQPCGRCSVHRRIAASHAVVAWAHSHIARSSGHPRRCAATYADVRVNREKTGGLPDR